MKKMMILASHSKTVYLHQQTAIQAPFSFVELSGSPLSAEVLDADKLGVERETNDVNLTVNWEVSNNLMLTSISGACSFNSLEVFDADGTQTWF